MYINPNGMYRRVNIASALEQYLQSNVPKDIRISEHLSEVFYPLKYLPVVAQDVTTKDGIVIVKGTIVSMVGQIGVNDIRLNYRFPLPSDTGTTDTGISVLPIADDMISGGTIGISANNSHWGYPLDHIGAVVPANGGNNVTYDYSALDVTLGTYMYTGALATASDTLVIPANRPIGVAMTHYVQDSRGKRLNYYNPMNKAFGVYTDGYLNVPFINWPLLSDELSDTGNFYASAGYEAIKTLFPFAYVNTGTESVTEGQWVNSDRYGRFVLDTGSTFNIQTVGKFIGADFRMPREFQAYIDNHLGSTLQGTMTGGIEESIFLMAYLVYSAATGTAPSISDIVNLVQTGCVGSARILLMLS